MARGPFASKFNGSQKGGDFFSFEGMNLAPLPHSGLLWSFSVKTLVLRMIYRN